MYTYCIDMKAALLNLQEVTYCILLPTEACSQYSYLRNYFVLLSWKKKKRVSLLAISTCKMTYWCILFLGFVCVRVLGGECLYCAMTLLLHIPWIGLFNHPSSPLFTQCSLPSPCIPLNCGAVHGVMFGVRQGENWSIISVLFAASLSCLMPCTQLSRFEDLG